ncbi:MAG: hypothetical protein AAGK17_13730 [Pseudomonadota bacterium]
MAYRLLAIAVGSGRAGYIFFIGDRLTKWEMSRQAAGSPAGVQKVVSKWLKDLAPDAIILEQLTKSSRKGARVRSINAQIKALAEQCGILAVETEPMSGFKNKYEAAAHLVERFPELKPYQPKRPRFYDKEPRTTVLFDALALAVAVRSGPAQALAAGIG